MEKAHDVVREKLKSKAVKQKDKYDVRAYSHKYQAGNIVWYRDESTRLGECPKLKPCYIGPCVILKSYPTHDYLIQKEAKGKGVVVHHDKLKPYSGNKPPSWIKSA